MIFTDLYLEPFIVLIINLKLTLLSNVLLFEQLSTNLHDDYIATYYLYNYLTISNNTVSEEELGNKLEGKIAVITGGNSDIGLAIAKRFVSERAYVFITGRRQNEIDAAISEIGKNVMGVQGDVSNLADIDRLYNTLNNEKGQIDILFANAGVVEFSPLGEIIEEHFDRISYINVKGYLFTIQKAHLIFQDDGSIILNASDAAYKGTATFSVYSLSKAAIRSFDRTWSIDLKHRKIRVNAFKSWTYRYTWY
jgi:NAD(P)-dependent dehydrogenase (short-subunit alcohol dehydrogenase family)